jgi:hypothetical protein
MQQDCGVGVGVGVAIYYFIREYHERTKRLPYSGEYDDLLWFYVFTYNLIQNRYKYVVIINY